MYYADDAGPFGSSTFASSAMTCTQVGGEIHSMGYEFGSFMGVNMWIEMDWMGI